MPNKVINVVVAGLGGQGILKASDILADVAFRAGKDVKKSEIHGMSQRGGSVTSDVRLGEGVLSPMIPVGEADYLLSLSPEHLSASEHMLNTDGGTLISAEIIDMDALPNKKSLNVAMLGSLSAYLDIPEDVWLDTIRATLPEKLHEANEQAFRLGRAAVQKS